MPSASYGLRLPASASCLERHARLAGRCPNNSSLFPPLAAVVVVAGHVQRKIYFNFVVQESLRTFLNHIFTRKVVKINCICRTVFGLANLYYQYFRFYISSVLYYNEANNFTSQKYRRLFS